ncbi:PREDICTED: cytochrome b-245 light chain-like [Priapulus caudatus]|uniref:Cytochrome b-245 light chain n=1 Tax=Priapulus caudatus TaxID=37621 RepID=A0ABM1E0F4_PRICU|nr:PREDICTED: cytochrome b-245 light chain-like [Priapulus caudatus]XP_014665673.1 PREDICTED: cytochrome b-245 light chain-like [Priapulus caudatus]XP_014665675.1 PREDICTED: cytochrome b-245 light chain-like [Priapulus caudatus]
MRQIEWSMWANEQALTSALLTFIGGVMGITQVFKNWGFGLYGIIISILVGLFEYPRGKRMKGTTNERMYQRFITVALSKLGFFSQNYFIRFILYILIGVPCCFQLPIVLGGICFFCTSIIYFVAAMKGESWKPAGLEKPDRQGSQVVAGVVSNPPPVPPPRLPEDVAQSVLQRQMSGRRI